MAQGRPRTTEASKRAHGTMRPDRKDPAPLHAPTDPLPRRPKRLKGPAQWYWDKWIKTLWRENWMSAKSVQGFTMLCETYGLYERMRLYCEKHGYTHVQVTKNGLMEKKRPQFEIMMMQKAYLQKYYHEFGFTALGERRAPPEPPATADEKKDIMKFLGKDK